MKSPKSFPTVKNDSIIFGLKPFHGIILGELVWVTDATSFAFSVSDVHSGATKNNVEVHTINT